MPGVTFTDLSVRSLKEGIYYDARTPAFGIRIGKLRKTWIVVRGKARTKTVVGHYPAMGLSEARTAARKLLVEPIAAQSFAINFSDARTRYLNEHPGRPGTKKELARLLVRRFGALDGRELPTISDQDIHRAIDKLAPSERLHAFRAVRALLRWAQRPPRRFILHSPLEGYVPPGQDGRRTRIVSDAEISLLLNRAHGQCGAIIHLMLLWGTRRGETLGLRRDWIEGDVLTIPASHTKNGRPLPIPLLPLARSILDELPDLGVHYFAGSRKNEVHINLAMWGKMHRNLLKVSGTEGWSAHDLRRTFRSACARLGVRRETAERLLNHAQGTLDQIYDHYDYMQERRDALARVEEWITKLRPLGGTTQGSRESGRIPMPMRDRR